MISYQTHDCKITMHNTATGNHRTLRIRTQPASATWAPGARVIGLLSGRDNESSYRTFGFVQQDGTISVWKRFKDSEYAKLAYMVQHQVEYEQKGVEFLLEARCRRCGRTLTTPESIQAGIGPECAKRG